MTFWLLGIKTPKIMNFANWGIHSQPRETEPVDPDGLARENSNISLPGCQATRCFGTSHMDIWGVVVRYLSSLAAWQQAAVLTYRHSELTLNIEHFDFELFLGIMKHGANAVNI